MKKGDVSQIFVYITAIIVFGVVFLFGYRAINHFLDESDKVGFITFKTDLEKAVRTIKNDFESAIVYSAERPLRIPSKYTTLCFVDFTGHDVLSPCPSELSSVACDTWKTYSRWEDTTSNVFTVPDGPVQIKVTPIKLFANGQQVSHLCVQTRGRVDVRMVGKGSYTLVSVS
ncbi:hypothetical protein J4207_03805 [Candidatus Woesearchaeota archaeon]|nr:hypothetical protein [Candidatus Woesearchaeota archaeon]